MFSGFEAGEIKASSLDRRLACCWRPSINGHLAGIAAPNFTVL